MRQVPTIVLSSVLRAIGLYIVFSGVARLSSFPMDLFEYDQESKDLLLPDSWPLLVVAAILGTIVFSVVPGMLLATFPEKIADRFADSPESPSPTLSDTGLYVILVLGLAIFFLVTGTGQFLVGITQAAFEFSEESRYRSFRFALVPLVDGAVRIFASAWLYRHSLEVSRPAA